MRYLVLSDIHANRAALDAVMKAARGEYDAILNCGDVVGYGPDPNYAVEFCREHSLHVVRGNHDRASVGMVDLEWFNPAARASARWTETALKPGNAEWVLGLPQGPLLLDGMILVHGSPADEDEYLLSTVDARLNVAWTPTSVALFGHSHLQGGFQVGRSGDVRGLEGLDQATLDETSTWFINPGSVGQPRDGDPRAAWALYDDSSRVLEWRRTEYDVSDTYHRILAAGLPEVLGLRLFRGS